MAQYDTPLTPDEEQRFQAWKQKYAPKDSGADYDLRGAFKAGLTPNPQTGHWPDTFKKPNHPTFSDQSKYAVDAPDLAGTWQGETYIPSRGRQLQDLLRNPKVPEDAKRRAVALYDSMKQTAAPGATTTTPTTTAPGGSAGLAAKTPAILGSLAGMGEGAELGAPLGPLGVVGGAGVGGALGAMGGELPTALVQRGLGMRQGQAPLIPRIAQVGREGLKGGLIGEIAGPAVQKGMEALGSVPSRLGGLTRALATTRGGAGTIAAAARHETSQIAQQGEQLLKEFGETAQKQAATQRSVRALRNVLRDVLHTGAKRTTGVAQEAGDVLQGMPGRLGQIGKGLAEQPGHAADRIEKIVNDTINEASVGERLAAHPGAMDALVARVGKPAQTEMQRAWWTKTLAEATGTKGLQKGVLDGGKVGDAWDALGPKQQQIFGAQAPLMDRFVQTVRQGIGGAVPEKVAPIQWSAILPALAAIMGRGTEARAIQAAAAGGISLGGPFLAAKLLTSPQGVQALTKAFMAAASLAPVAGQAAQIGAQTASQMQAQP